MAEERHFRWWLSLQIGLASTGGLTWLVGTILEEAFVSGAGFGLLVAALVLRVARAASD